MEKDRLKELLTLVNEKLSEELALLSSEDSGLVQETRETGIYIYSSTRNPSSVVGAEALKLVKDLLSKLDISDRDTAISTGSIDLLTGKFLSAALYLLREHNLRKAEGRIASDIRTCSPRYFPGQNEFFDRFVDLKAAHKELRDLVELSNSRKPDDPEEAELDSGRTHISDTPGSSTASADGTTSAASISEAFPLTSTPRPDNLPAMITHCSQSPVKYKN